MKILALISVIAIITSGCRTMQKAESSCNGSKTHDWSAWNNLMPGAEHNVHVIGKATVNSGGWHAELSKKIPQGFNPQILLLDLKLTPPTGPSSSPVVDLDLSFTEKLGTAKFSQVQVFCGDKLVADLPVKDSY